MKNNFRIILATALLLSFLFSTDALAQGKTSFGSPLVNAADSGNTLLLKDLVRRGANVNKRGKFESTALMRAAYHGYTAIGEYLIKSGANVNALDLGGATALHLVAREGHGDFTDLLIKNNADLNARDGEGWTALMRAVAANKSAIAISLINNKANIDISNFRGENALILAVKRKNEQLVRLLLEKNVDITAKNNNGASAFDIARDRNLGNIADLLAQSQGQKSSQEIANIPASLRKPARNKLIEQAELEAQRILHEARLEKKKLEDGDLAFEEIRAQVQAKSASEEIANKYEEQALFIAQVENSQAARIADIEEQGSQASLEAQKLLDEAYAEVENLKKQRSKFEKIRSEHAAKLELELLEKRRIEEENQQAELAQIKKEMQEEFVQSEALKIAELEKQRLKAEQEAQEILQKARIEAKKLAAERAAFEKENAEQEAKLKIELAEKKQIKEEKKLAMLAQIEAQRQEILAQKEADKLAYFKEKRQEAELEAAKILSDAKKLSLEASQKAAIHNSRIEKERQIARELEAQERTKTQQQIETLQKNNEQLRKKSSQSSDSVGENWWVDRASQKISKQQNNTKIEPIEEIDVAVIKDPLFVRIVKDKAVGRNQTADEARQQVLEIMQETKNFNSFNANIESNIELERIRNDRKFAEALSKERALLASERAHEAAEIANISAQRIKAMEIEEARSVAEKFRKRAVAEAKRIKNLRNKVAEEKAASKISEAIIRASEAEAEAQLAEARVRVAEVEIREKLIKEQIQQQKEAAELQIAEKLRAAELAAQNKIQEADRQIALERAKLEEEIIKNKKEIEQAKINAAQQQSAEDSAYESVVIARKKALQSDIDKMLKATRIKAVEKEEAAQIEAEAIKAEAEEQANIIASRIKAEAEEELKIAQAELKAAREEARISRVKMGAAEEQSALIARSRIKSAQEEGRKIQLSQIRSAEKEAQSISQAKIKEAIEAVKAAKAKIYSDEEQANRLIAAKIRKADEEIRIAKIRIKTELEEAQRIAKNKIRTAEEEARRIESSRLRAAENAAQIASKKIRAIEEEAQRLANLKIEAADEAIRLAEDRIKLAEKEANRAANAKIRAAEEEASKRAEAHFRNSLRRVQSLENEASKSRLEAARSRSHAAEEAARLAEKAARLAEEAQSSGNSSKLLEYDNRNMMDYRRENKFDFLTDDEALSIKELPEDSLQNMKSLPWRNKENFAPSSSIDEDMLENEQYKIADSAQKNALNILKEAREITSGIKNRPLENKLQIARAERVLPSKIESLSGTISSSSVNNIYWLKLGDFSTRSLAKSHFKNVMNTNKSLPRFNFKSIKDDNSVSLKIGPLASAQKVMEACRLFQSSEFKCSTIIDR